MKLIDKLKDLFRGRPPTEEELVALAESEAIRQGARNESAEDHIRHAGR